MESKQYNRKFNSCFWAVLYFMPILILLLSLIGNYYISRNTGDNLEVNYNYLFQFEIIDNDFTFNGSFFDVSLINTDNTFKNFQLPFLRNAFESLFNLLNFESSYISSFVLTTFTWMVQFMLLHVFVDSLAFIFKIYHKLMDKVV